MPVLPEFWRRLFRSSQLETIKILEFFCCFQLVKSHSHTIKLLDYFAAVSNVTEPHSIICLPFALLFSVITLTEVWTKGSLSACKSIDDWVFFLLLGIQLWDLVSTSGLKNPPDSFPSYCRDTHCVDFGGWGPQSSEHLVHALLKWRTLVPALLLFVLPFNVNWIKAQTLEPMLFLSSGLLKCLHCLSKPMENSSHSFNIFL